ncbi:MAG TPA: cation:proton antiporter, partial [Chitinispirillaceae bacterium]|nr:cation:proton antiporter [Chitinispirillaceae bacterium]
MIYQIIMTVLALPALVMASEESGSMVHRMANLVFQISIILFAARFTGMLFKKLKFPSVLGELIAGIVIGPSVLGSVAVPLLFEHGIF